MLNTGEMRGILYMGCSVISPLVSGCRFCTERREYGSVLHSPVFTDVFVFKKKKKGKMKTCRGVISAYGVKKAPCPAPGLYSVGFMSFLFCFTASEKI